MSPASRLQAAPLSAVPRRPARSPGSGRAGVRRLRAAASAWTPAIVCVLAYLFVITSGRLKVGTLAIVLGLGFVLLEGKPLRVPPFLVALGLFLVWALATAPLALNPSVAYERWWDYSKFWLIGFLICNAVRTPAQWRLVTVGWLALFALFPFRGIVYNFLTGNMTQGRYAWNFSFYNPNDYAAIALLALSLAIVHVRPGGPRWVRLSAFCGMVALPVAILLTGSRAGLISMVVLGSVLLAFSKRRLGITVLALAVSVVAIPLLPESTKARFAGIRMLTSAKTIAQADQYGSALERSVILTVAKTVAAENMAHGVGIGNYRFANAAYAARRPEWQAASGFRDAHNTFLTLAAETGLVGLGLFGSAVILVAVGLVRERRAELRRAGPSASTGQGFAPVALLAGLTGYVVMCATGSYVYLAFPYLFAALAARYRAA